MIGPPVMFEPVPNSYRGKVACTVCGRTGYDGRRSAFSPWQRTCQRGHAPCAACGRMLVVKLDGTPRVHTRCPGRA